MTSWEEEVDRLYAAPFEEFVSERNELAKRLRGEGDRARADEVRALKKPSASAWALNQAIHADRDAAENLLASGRRLEAAQQAALEGSGGTELREAIADHNAAIERMVAATQASDEAARLGPAMLDRVRETMRALASDEALQGEFAAGRVVRDRRPVGFGGATAAPAPRRAKKRAERSAKERAARKRRIERAERARDSAARRFREAQQRLDRAETAVEKARTRVAEAETKFAAAEEELGESRAEN